MNEQTAKKTSKRTETRRAARNHVFNIIFQTEFNDISEIDDAVLKYYEAIEHEAEQEEAYGESFDFEIDKEFISKELKGIVSNFSNIDDYIKKYAVGWTVDRMSKVDLAILRLAVFEIVFSEIPNKVAVNEAVELAKEYSSEKAPAFINGILGKIVSENGDKH